MAKSRVLGLFEKIKTADRPLRLEFDDSEGKQCRLEAVTTATADDPSAIALFAKWREENSDAFPAQFKVTLEGTLAWFEKGLMNQPERVLFWVVDSVGNRVGHVGLFRIIGEATGIELDNILRGEVPAAKSIMFHALERLMRWQYDDLQIPQSYLRVFSNNPRALQLYEKLGFREIQRLPLKSVRSPGRVDWQEITNSPYEVAEKYFITMRRFEDADG